MHKNIKNYNDYKFIEKNFYNLRNQICSSFESIEKSLTLEQNIGLLPGKFKKKNMEKKTGQRFFIRWRWSYVNYAWKGF